jgi:hypothetical protein
VDNNTLSDKGTIKCERRMRRHLLYIPSQAETLQGKIHLGL